MRGWNSACKHCVMVTEAVLWPVLETALSGKGYLNAISALIRGTAGCQFYDGNSGYGGYNCQAAGPKEFDAPQQTRLGPLTPADTLWRLAEQARPDRRINMYQMMYALYQKNPDAFLEENFNHLKPGAFLLLPSVREILAVDALEAQRKSENDDRIWAERVRRAELAKAEAAAAKQLDIVTAKEQLSEELSRVEAQQTEQISDLRNRIGASMANVETIVQENTELETATQYRGDKS